MTQPENADLKYLPLEHRVDNVQDAGTATKDTS